DQMSAAEVAAHRAAMLTSLRLAQSRLPAVTAPKPAPDEENGANGEKPKMLPSVAEVAAIKGLSYRIIVSISHLFVNYYWTGNYFQTGALEILQIVINSAKFYVHELFWETYLAEIPRGDLGRVVDFNYIA